MLKTVIADTSCLIILHNIGELELLKHMYGNVYTTPEVAEEFSEELPKWILIEKVADEKYQEVLELQVDSGEASAIALALEKDESLLIIDDLKARKLAEKLHLKYTGTLGVIASAKQKGIIPAIKPIINKIQHTNFRIAEELVYKLLSMSNEL